ncbi:MULTISPECIES: DUF5615 family PIN-like protein [unclassified Halorhabdus]|uniref:DUF5615 family PIN-like protein n=1 Tax=unclassified Halorhabdus TaxID=2621901 RepID=UPI0023DA7649|nr:MULTISPECIES: DUF5615 family PIN-like protein [unclassified Halorhabdus]WEL18762.1 hypothetical protein SVXHr_2618 [Halorhabdus sp. SVX81]WEL22544.1 hypothetical protein HBNXHr_2501 [Halorhabdus sp. BNX81]
MDFAGVAGRSIPREKGTLGEPDREQLRYAVENDWLLLTFDDDFLSLVKGEGLEHTGIIYVRQAGRQIGDVVKVVDEHLQHRSDDDQSIQYL